MLNSYIGLNGKTNPGPLDWLASVLTTGCKPWNTMDIDDVTTEQSFKYHMVLPRKAKSWNYGKLKILLSQIFPGLMFSDEHSDLHVSLDTSH